MELILEKGYDVIFSSYSGGYNKKGGHTNVFRIDNEFDELDEEGYTTNKKILGKDMIKHIRENGSKSPYFERATHIFSEEVLFSDALGESIENGRNIISIEINADFAGVDPTYDFAPGTKLGNDAYSTGHEFIFHAMDDSRELGGDSHLRHNGVSGDATMVAPGFDGEKLGEQIQVQEKKVK